MSFQGGALFTSMSVGENVALPLREHFKLDENTIRIMSRLKLEVVNLGGFQDLMPSQLSGAMAAAHEAAAKCLESGKKADACQKELQAACKGLAIGKYCGMKHEH